MKMNSGRSDASTSTDDVPSRPLCLFYFTHPFGVLSPEPPTLAAAPAHIARAFVNMQPVASGAWGPPPACEPPGGPARPEYELGRATVHAAPVDVLRVARARRCTLGLAARRESLSSSLFSGDVWFDSGSSGRSDEYARRLIPLNRILPPLRLPSPRDSSTLDSSDDLWPKKCLNPEKFSLPPIELPTDKVKIVRSEKCVRSGQADEAGGGGGARAVRVRRRVGVAKPRRAARPHELRRMLAALTRRSVAGGTGRGASPALRDALSTIREAWAEPRSLRARSRAARREPAARAMERAEARRDASPGLLHRRYSVPETIMRKYRLAQLRSDPEESVPATSRSAASASPPPDAARPGRATWRDRELMRRSALMRRAWGRADCRGCCCCRDERAPGAGRETRSLDGSRSELRHSPGGLAGLAGWATPKRQRLESRDSRGSDEMLRAAMRNSYDRAEETRDRAVRTDLSDSTYRSHADHPDMMMDAFTDSDMSKCDERPETLGREVFTQYSERQSSETTTVEIKSTDDTCMTGHTSPVQRNEQHISDERSLSDSSDTFSPSLCTAKETLDGRPLAVLTRDERVKESTGQHAEDIYDVGHNFLPYRMPLTVGTAPSYEVLEIVVSETLNTDPVPAIRAPTHDDKPRPSALRAAPRSQRSLQNINIDEYVSNILVESLNSLTDQLECMSASIGSNGKISVVEKEIKIKLQNTGVNTIVHLSPTSNNPIIFGNEELFNEDSRRDACNNALTIREEVHSVESNNNEVSSAAPDSGAPCPCDSFDIRHDHVNQAVLQQIQKLFQDELNGIAPADYPTGMPEISHIEISDVDTFIDNAEAELAAQDEQSSADLDPCQYKVIGGIGTCNYYPDVGSHPVVPRFSALPHTDSMEVNTSSSEDADIIGSECTSLVDSLDDPNSPRSVLLRRAYSGRRSELVRSAIDVLDLLPENICTDNTPREKPESFFIGIKDNECDCDKENVNVADRMPEKIKQRLYRRHRKRELRMECARRSRSRQRAGAPRRARRDVERDCMAIVNALIDDVIAKIAQDEYKCMRIKHRPTKMLSAKSDDNVTKRTWRKDLEPINNREPFKAIKNGCVRFDTKERRAIEKNEQHQIHGKLSLRSPPATDNRTAKRIYQKSEIHEGNKCIEILEILEYVNGSQSSPENTNSDENQNHCTKNKKSRIPVPIAERSQKSPNGESQKNNNRRWSGERRGTERNDNTNRLITDMLLEALAEQERAPPPRRASVPAAREPREPRERANSLRFRQVFDIIPEERSSLSLDSGTEDLSYNRRASAPDIVEEYHIDEPSERECDDVPPPISPLRAERSTSNGDRQRVRRPSVSEIHRKYKETKSAATSPMSDIDADKRGVRSRHQTTMTSPSCKSAATSPLRAPPAPGRARAATEGVNEKNAQPDEPPARRPATTARPSQSERKEPRERPRRDVRPDRQPARRPTLARSQSHEQVSPNDHAAVDTAPSPGEPRRKDHLKSNQKRNSRTLSLERSEEETIHSVKLPEFKGGGGAEGAVGASSSDSSESGGSLLCPLAPRWLAPGRARRAARRRATAPPAPAPPAPAAPVAGSSDSPAPHHQARDETGAGAWSVTVAGSCRAALPHDVEMRLRFPHERDAQAHTSPVPCQVAECPCRHCARCACARGSPGPRAPPLPAARADGKLTLTMKKEAFDSSILASKSSRKSSAQLPDVETYRASRSRLKSSVKTRRGYSLHCWLPDSEDAPIRARDGLSVLGCAIVPELKPRVRTMSERDLTRVYTPRLYLRS